MEEYYRGKRCLVTGGLGFIGSHLVDDLINLGADVVVVDALFPELGGSAANSLDFASTVEVIIGNLACPVICRRAVRGCSHIFHLAADNRHLASLVDPCGDLHRNCEATLALLSATIAENTLRKIVFTSTRQVYGAPVYLPVDELHPAAPLDFNGVNKRACEEYLRLASGWSGVSSCVLRLTNVYGPRMRIVDANQGVIGLWIGQLLSGNPITIMDGTQRRDILYVKDAIQAILRTGANCMDSYGIYNVGHLHSVALREIAESIIYAFGSGSYSIIDFEKMRKSIDIGDYCTDSTQLFNATGWIPTVSLERGMKMTAEAFLQTTFDATGA